MQKITLLFLAFMAVITACDNSGSSGTSFDRSTMLRHYADQLIRPAYQDLQTEVTNLQSAFTAFSATPDAARLDQLRSAWAESFRAWQGANAFNFGPAGESGLRKTLAEEIGTFPANSAQIETFIAAGDFSLNNFNRDTRGFLAIEYLLYGPLADNLLTDSARRNYLGALIENLKIRIDEVVSGWATYSNTFTSNNGTDSGSSISMLYNEFVKSYEVLKNFKVGLPAGKRPGQTQPEPQLVEAYYSGLSREMLLLHMAAIERIYYGQAANGTDGPGFVEYLESVTGGPELVNSTEAQLQVVNNALQALPVSPSFSELIAAGHPTVETLNTELQKHTRFFKSDMSSLLGIAITFSSGDGD